ncbi:MAG: ATP-binding protein [Gemmatimonadota bacterium]
MGLLVAAVGVLLTLVVQRMTRRADDLAIRTQVLQEATPTANALETSINRRMALLHGVASFLAVNWGRPTLVRDFDDFGTRILSGVPGVRTVQYHVDGKIVQTVPLAGNEAAIGRSVLDDPRPGVALDMRKAMDTDGVVLSGPIELYQGGRGLIGRLAFRNAEGRVLGVAAIVLDLEPMLHEAGVNATQPLRFQLRDSHGALIAGDLATTPEEPPVRTDVQLPDRRWVLESMPSGGWRSREASAILPFGVRVGFVILLLSLTAFLARSRQLARKRAVEAELRRTAEEKFARLFALIPDGVVLTRQSDGLILEINTVMLAMTGLTREELVGKTTIETGLWTAPEGRAQMLAALADGAVISEYAAALPRRGGGLRECRLSGRAVTFDGVECLLVLIRDVHDQQQMERRLAEAARLESVGRLAGGIAHDFNNLITAMRGYADLLGERFAGDSAALADLREVSRAADRAASLTRQLLAFARKQMVQPRLIDVNAVLLGAHRLLQQLAGDEVRVITSIAPVPTPVLIDPAQFEQVLTNLTANARDAMPHGGVLRIQTAVAGSEVVVTVSDDGVGMTPEALEHLFEPFFTTKLSGRGTGLGLATCYGIVQQAGGRIEVSSLPAAGTTFRVHFPRAEGVVESSDSAAEARPSPRGTETILIAEDEPQIRRLATRVLQGLGYTVLAGADGHEARALAAGRPATIDLLLTDMVMPGMGGGELVRRIQEDHASVALLLMSGYSEELVAAEYGGAPFLAKPFTPAELAEAVRRALDGGQ